MTCAILYTAARVAMDQRLKAENATARVKVLEDVAAAAPAVISKKSFALTVIPSAEQSRDDGGSDWIPIGVFPVR